MTAMTALATISCPQCGRKHDVAVPPDRCLVFAVCPHCQTRITPRAGECCVICSHSEARCAISVKG